MVALEQFSSCSTQASMLVCWLTKWRGMVPLHGWLTLAGLEAGKWGTLHGHYWKTLLKRFLDACLSFSCIPVTLSVVNVTCVRSSHLIVLLFFILKLWCREGNKAWIHTENHWCYSWWVSVGSWVWIDSHIQPGCSNQGQKCTDWSATSWELGKQSGDIFC